MPKRGAAMLAHHSLSVLGRNRKRARRAKCTHVHPPNPPASPGLAGFPSPVISLRPGHRHSGAEQRHKLRVVTITPHSDYNIVRVDLESVPFVEYMADLSQNVTAPTGHARPRLISQQKKGAEGKRECKKWVFCPVWPLPSHQPRDYQPTYQRLFPSMQHLVSKEVCLPFPLPWRPLAHIQGSCILCCSGTARDRASVVSPSESPTPDEASANRWTSAMAGSQNPLSSRQEPHGGTCFYVCIHNNGAILWTVSPST